VPLLFNWVERGRSPMLALERIAELGFALVIMPVATLFSATAAMTRYLEEIRLRGTPLALLDHAVDFERFGELMNLPAIRSFEARISGADA
jgi:2-methylisocitrate lyase-like PEP mutase family enzyme